MATKLKNLKIRKVDFVDEGANPDAHIKMIKRKDGGETEEEGGRKESGSILKKLFGFIGKAAGMDQSEIDMAVEEIQKSDSVSFREKINEVNNRKIADEMWDVCYALQSSLCSILNDEEMDSSGAETAMLESLEEFYELVKESISKWSGGKEASIVRKSGEVSEKELEIMKAAVERLNESIEKEKSNGDGSDKKEKRKGEQEEMRIDKSKLTDAEKAFLESIEKRYGTDDGANSSDDGTAGASAPSGQALPPTQVKPPVAKSVEQSAADTGAQAEEGNSIYKGLHPAVRAELEDLKKFREAAEARELTEIAKRYAVIGKKEEELVPLLKNLREAGGTAYSDMIALLDQAAEAVEKSGVFSEIGKSGHGTAEGGAWAEAEAKATELMKSKAGLSKAQALDEVLMADPELAAKCEREG